MSDVRSDLVESRHLRRSVGQFVTGVTVVTYDVEGSRRGVTVNSFTSVSVDPPLILVSIARCARAAAGLSGASLVVNVLAADQLDLARHFAGRSVQDMVDTVVAAPSPTAVARRRRLDRMPAVCRSRSR